MHDFAGEFFTCFFLLRGLDYISLGVGSGKD